MRLKRSPPRARGPDKGGAPCNLQEGFLANGIAAGKGSAAELASTCKHRTRRLQPKPNRTPTELQPNSNEGGRLIANLQADVHDGAAKEFRAASAARALSLGSLRDRGGAATEANPNETPTRVHRDSNDGCPDPSAGLGAAVLLWRQPERVGASPSRTPRDGCSCLGPSYRRHIHITTSIEASDQERKGSSGRVRSYLLSDCYAEITEVAKKISPRPKKISKTDQDVAAARRTIIEAARDLFVERGFHHTSVGDVAAKAEVSRATCYYQFTSKNGILDAVIADAHEKAPVTLRSWIRHPATLPRPEDNLRGLITDICLIWEQDRPLFRRVMVLGEVDPELGEVIESWEMERSHAIDAISHRLMARYSRRATVEALWMLTGFPVFDAIRRHASFDEAIEMVTGMAVTVVDPEQMWGDPPAGC
jgi:AcrR family transcriptional regulator